MLAYLGVPVPVAQLRDELEVSEKHETSFHKLASCARRHGMKAVGFKMDLEDFIKLREPVIVRVRTEDKFHFTVALPRPEGIVSIFEPVYSAQPIMVPLDEFAESFTGDVLVVRNRDALPGEELAFMPEPLRSGGAAGQESNQQGSPDRKPRVAIAPATPARSPRGNASKPGSGSNEPNAPRIEFESEALDFGPLHSGEDQMQGVFHFRNTGAATLIIDKIQAGCSCTVSTLAKREYAPGEKGEIGVTVDMSDRLGDFRTRVTVKTNDPKNEEVDLDLHCFVFHDPQVYPDVVSLGTLDVGSELRRSLKVKLPTSPSQPDAEIVAIRTPVAALNCSLLPSSQRIEAAILYDVVCELQGPVPVGSIDGDIEISYKSMGEAGVLSVSVSGQVFDGFAASPSAVWFGLFPADERELVRIVTLRSLRSTNLIVEEVRCDEPALTVQQLSEKPDGQLKLRVVLNPERLSGLGILDAMIQIRSKAGGQLSIRVSGKSIVGP